MIILGGGISALALAYYSSKLCAIRERESKLGGLCQSEVIDGWTTDMGVHTVFCDDPAVDELYRELLPDMIEKKSDAKIWFGDNYIPFPFQANLWQVNESVRNDCRSYFLIKDEIKPKKWTLATKLQQAFGAGMFHYFFGPYNEKKYGINLDRLVPDYAQRKNPELTWEEVERGCEGPTSKEYGHNKKLRYPKSGGFGALIEALRTAIKVEPKLNINTHISFVDLQEKKICHRVGLEFSFNTVISTIPLPDLLRITYNLPNEIAECGKKLSWGSVWIVSIGIKGEPETKFDWAYYPQKEICFSRLSQPSNWADYVAPDGKWLIQAEIPVTDEADTPPKLIDDLCLTKIINEPADKIWSNARFVKYAYPHITHDTRKAVATIKEFYAQNDIHLLGRFGQWAYLDSDRCISEAKKLAAILS